MRRPHIRFLLVVAALVTLPTSIAAAQAWVNPKGELGLTLRFMQTNHEGAFVEHLHRLEGMTDGIVLNPGAWTHYAWSIHDALELTGLPAVEVHLSDVNAREEWRRVSVIRDVCVASVVGKGIEGYREGLRALRDHLDVP